MKYCLQNLVEFREWSMDCNLKRMDSVQEAWVQILLH